MPRTDGAGERGFSYLEVVVAMALTSAVVLAMSGAVANALHATALVRQKASLEEDALNTLADVRAIVAYGDGAAADRASQILPRLFGRTSSQTIVRANGTRETIAISLGPQPPGATQTIAAVTASANGVSVTERQVVYYEAPAPGSSVTEP